ncbi:hypothetical protein ACV6RL_001192 [Cronobacter sakazakii]
MKYLFFWFLVFISGCKNYNPVVSPEIIELPVAVINEKYLENIEIIGGAVNKSSVSVSITPADSGLMWKPKEIKYNFDGKDDVKEDYHHIIIFGMPKK